MESGGEEWGVSVSYLKYLVYLEGRGMYRGENGEWRGREKWRVRNKGFSRLQVPVEGCFRRSLSFPSRITPSIPADKLQIQHFLLCMPSCELLPWQQ